MRILLGRGSVGILMILSTVYFAYELSKSIFALIALYETAVSLSRVLIDLGLHFRVLREAPPLLYSGKRDEAIRKIILPSCFLRLLASILTVVLFVGSTWLVKPWLTVQFPELDIEFIIGMTAIHMMLTMIEAITTSVFSVMQKFGIDAFLDSGSALLESVLALLLYVQFGVEYYFVGITLGIGIMVAVRFFVLWDILSDIPQMEFSWSEARVTLKAHFPFYLRRFFRVGFTQAEQLLIPFLLSLNQLASFKVAKKLSGFLRNYVQAFADPLLIKLSKSRDLKDRKKYIRTFLLFTVPLPVGLTSLSPWIMKYLGGPKYEDAWLMLAVIYVSYIFYSLSSLQFVVVSVFGKPTETLYRDMIGGIVGLVGTLVCILLFAEYGIAWGQLISYVVMYIIGWRIAQRHLEASIHPKPVS